MGVTRLRPSPGLRAMLAAARKRAAEGVAVRIGERRFAHPAQHRRRALGLREPRLHHAFEDASVILAAAAMVSL